MYTVKQYRKLTLLKTYGGCVLRTLFRSFYFFLRCFEFGNSIVRIHFPNFCIDDECSYAYEIMARIAKMQGNLDAETDSLAKAIECSRDYREIFEYFISYYSAKARQEVQSRFGFKTK